MKRTKVLSLLLMAACVVSLAAGCGNDTATKETTGESSTGQSEETSKDAAKTKSGEHGPITIGDYNRDYTKLIELVHEKYPEINVQIVPCKGNNATGYMKKQIETGSMPDIYVTTQAWDDELQKEHLIDLSEYPVSELYNQVRLNEYDVDGGIYLLPYDYAVQGIQYNKTLLEKNNIAVPTSFKQLREETIPALQEAGIEISEDVMNLPGYPFQYFFSLAYTNDLNTLEGKAWMDDFIAGKEKAGDVLASSVDYFQQWIDCGMVDTAYEEMDSTAMNRRGSRQRTGCTAG